MSGSCGDVKLLISPQNEIAKSSIQLPLLARFPSVREGALGRTPTLDFCVHGRMFCFHALTPLESATDVLDGVADEIDVVVAVILRAVVKGDQCSVV